MTTTTDYHKAVADVARMAAACGVPPDWRRMWFDAETGLVDLRTATDTDLARLRRIESAARAWHAARDGAISGGNWLPGPPARRYDDACALLAAVLTATADGASGDDRAARIEAAVRAVLASGQARYDSADGGFPEPVARAEEVAYYGSEPRYVGDLVPAAAMTALRAAVEGA